MSRREEPEVLVVGAGPVGLMSALLLARRGIHVQIVDRDWRTGAHSYALALHARSMKLMDPIGLAERIRARSYPVHSVGVYDASDRKAEFRLTVEPGDMPVAVLEQNILEGILEEALAELGVRVLWNHELVALEQDDRGVSATVDKLEKDSVGYATAHTEWTVAKTFEVRTPLVIGADGHRSTVRRALGIDYPEVGPSQHFAVFEFLSETNLEHEMRLIFGEETIDVLWPLPGDACRWSFHLPDFVLPAGSRIKDRLSLQIGRQQFPVLGEENLRALIRERAPWFGETVREIRWRIAVRFERRLADSFGSGRVWLAGDSGHMTGPGGMQSMNVGFLEAAELTAAMAGVLREGKPVESLDGYGPKRTAEWRGLLGLEGGLTAGPHTDPWIAQHADGLLPCLPASDGELDALLGQWGLGF